MRALSRSLVCVFVLSGFSTLAWAQTPIRLNSGGGTYTDASGRTWSSDYGFSGGSTATVGSSIANTVDDVLYRSERWGTFSYRFTVPAGSYRVTLKFAEIYYSRSGQRVFNVAINGTTVLADFDIAATAGGANIAVDRTFTTSVGSGSGNLQIQFIHMSGQPDDPKVDAIEIVSDATSAPVITSQPMNQTVVAGKTATFSVAATGTGTLNYQWRKNGTSIGGTTSSTYTTPVTSTADSGAQFSVVVSNSAGSATSNSAALTVNAATRLLSANPSSLSFGSVGISISSTLATTITNTGNSDVTISGRSISGAGLSISGLFTGQVLAPGQSAVLTVIFLPAITGNVTGSVVVTSDASNSPTTISLSGKGVLLTTHSTTLSWTSSTSQVVGYNVYSGTVSGGPYTKLTPSPATGTSYRDTTVLSGKTYFYVVTAVNSNSIESTFSNQVSAAIP